MMKTFVCTTVLQLYIVLSVYAGTAQAQTFVPADTTFDSSSHVEENVIIGYADQNSIDISSAPTNPTVRIAPGSSITSNIRIFGGVIYLSTDSIVHGTIHIYKKGNVTLKGGVVDRDVFVCDNSTLELAGGTIGPKLASYDSSTLSINGGEIVDSLTTNDNSQVTIGGGQMHNLTATGHSTVKFSGGKIVQTLKADGNSTVVLNGGSFGYMEANSSSTLIMNRGDFKGGLSVTDNSIVNINGGSVPGGLYLIGHSVVTINAGSSPRRTWAQGSSTLTIRGGDVTNLEADDSSTIIVTGGAIYSSSFVTGKSQINFFGTGLHAALNKKNALHGRYNQYTLVGKLRDGTSIKDRIIFVERNKGGRFTLTNAKPQKSEIHLSNE